MKIEVKTKQPQWKEYYNERVVNFEDEEKYLEYLVNLDLVANGTDSVFCEYEFPETYEAMVKEKDTKTLNEELDALLEVINNNVDALMSVVPFELVRVWGLNCESTDVYEIPEDDFLHSTSILLARILILRKILKEREGK